ncbi:MAG TPA: RsmE family RNA methyltransferase, partial [Myxococcaceae bacterium]|nr:RsmE family RNA methyltransferase [Myxococcaceae bacterium]
MFRVRLDVPTPAPERVRVEGAALHHLRVARIVPGEKVEVFDGRGRAWGGWLETVDEAGAVLRLGDERRGELGRPVVLIQGLPKGDKLDWVLQKSTELGVSAVWPVVTARSVARPKPEALGPRHGRWQRIVEEAARQSGRAEVPEVAPLRSLNEALKALIPGMR